jgi:hypothetical protein
VLLRNDSQNDNRWLAFRIIGNQRNRDGVGSIIRYTLNSKSRILQLQRTASYLSANDPRLFIGLGQMQMLQDMEIQWPNGRSKRLKTVKADQLITLVEE